MDCGQGGVVLGAMAVAVMDFGMDDGMCGQGGVVLGCMRLGLAFSLPKLCSMY